MKGMTSPEISPSDITRFPAASLQPFTMEMAREMKISPRQLNGPHFRRIMHGVFIDRRVPDSLPVRCRAAGLVGPPGGTVSHLTAGCLWTANAERSGYVHLSYQRARWCSRDEIKVHQFTYPLEISARHGLPVTSPGMTFMHLAVVLDLVKLTAFGDMLVKRRVITSEELMGYARAWLHHGARRGQQAAAFVRDRVESVPESNLRMLIVLAGLPEPTVNYSIYRRDGTELYRLDLAYEEIKLAVEYDGRWHDDAEQVVRDELRRAWLEAQGWTVIVVRAEDLYQDAETTVEVIADALSARGILLRHRRYDYQRYFGQILPAGEDPFFGPRSTGLVPAHLPAS